MSVKATNYQLLDFDFLSTYSNPRPFTTPRS